MEYTEWLIDKQRFQLFGSTQTDTGTLSVQNLSGNTVQRDVALAYARNEFIGAFVYYRLWRADAEFAIFQFMGNVVDADIDEQVMDLTLEGFGNYSAIRAPAYAIDVACPLFFGSMACGSTAATPCQQSYGTCSSIERFAGAVVQWDFSNGIAPLVQIAQPPPVASANLEGLLMALNPAFATATSRRLPLAFGYVQGIGDRLLSTVTIPTVTVPVAQQTALYLLGEGEWDGPEMLTVDSAQQHLENGLISTGNTPAAFFAAFNVSMHFHSVPNLHRGGKSDDLDRLRPAV